MTRQEKTFDKFGPKWGPIFRFFAENGAPKSAGFKAAYKAASFGLRSKLQFNIWAFLFGFMYFLAKGM